MMRFAAYPFMIYSKLSDTLEQFEYKINNLDDQVFIHNYEVLPYERTTPLNGNFKDSLWTVNVISTVNGLSDYFESQHYHDSKMEGLYCPEIGFIKMHYTFENGVKIYFDYIENPIE
jgi:hypothetical protein